MGASVAHLAIFHVALTHSELTTTVDPDEVARGVITIVIVSSDADEAMRVDVDASFVSIVVCVHLSKGRLKYISKAIVVWS